jgi:hypothetical protein
MRIRYPAGGFGLVGSAVLAVVVDDNDVEPSGIVLGKQGAQAARDDLGLVARGHDRDHVGPRAATVRGVVEPFRRAPEATTGENEIKPDREGNRGQGGHRRVLHRLQIHRCAAAANRAVMPHAESR